MDKMNRTIIYSATTVIALLNGCSFQQSVEKDLITGAFSRGEGISCEEVHIDTGGRTGKELAFVYGEKVNILFENVRGFTEQNGKVFPGLSIHVVENGQDTLLAYPDLFEAIGEGTDLSPLQMQANFTAVLPYGNKKDYKAYIKIWDKKGTGTFSYEMPFTVMESKLLDVRSSGLEYGAVYLWNLTRNEVVLDSVFSQKDSLILIIEGTEGFREVGDKVYPELSVALSDRAGRALLSNPNLLGHVQLKGIPSDDIAREDLFVKLGFTEGHIDNPCRLKVVLADSNSEKKIEVSGELYIQ